MARKLTVVVLAFLLLISGLALAGGRRGAPRTGIGLGSGVGLARPYYYPFASYSAQTAAYEINTRKPQDSIQPLARGDTTIFVVTSPSGIGGATIRVNDGNWPAKTIVSFRYPDGRAFASLEQFIVRGRVQRDLSVPRDKFQPTATSTDIELPMEIFEAAQPVIELNWIDAYR